MNLTSGGVVHGAGLFGLSVGLSTGLLAGLSTAAIAQTSYYYAGQIEDGQPLLVDLNSIEAAGDRNANFDYRLGDAAFASQAHCVGGGAWTTLTDGAVHYAQSQATRDMVRIVCSYLDQGISGPAPSVSAAAIVPPVSQAPISQAPISQVPVPQAPVSQAPVSQVPIPVDNPSSIQQALVFDPSSNVRATPNGRILCSIDTQTYINIYGSLGDWYNTDACGPSGVIHISQIQF